jgi:mono/diheme cytochrome c family protein
VRTHATARSVLVGLLFGLGLSAQTIKPVPIQPTTPTSGKAMYAEYCAVCHGPTGKGDGPAAAALKKRPSDLTLIKQANHGTFPDKKVANTIRGDLNLPAHGSKEMPIWGNLFKSIGNESTVDLRISNLTDYVKSLQAP